MVALEWYSVESNNLNFRDTLNACINSSFVYFDYLNKSNLGLEINDVVRVDFVNGSSEGYTYNLFLKKQLVSIEYIYITIDKVPYADEVTANYFDKKQKKLEVTVKSKAIKGLFDNVDLGNIFVVSDLKFLVSSVRKYYEAMIEQITMPCTTSQLTPPNVEDQDQQVALNTIFSTPMSYIWGAPGTGKTKVVLSEAVIKYVENGKSVAIFAPTNSSLEQILTGLLPELSARWIDTSTVTRLGAASEQFFELYPQVCEKQIKILDGKSKVQKKSLKNSMVIAMTLDTYMLREDLQTVDFCHIFLDEAGFAPLIKTLAVCTNGKPITLLGDHCQLKPVCEMDITTLKNPDYSDVCLWTQSGVYLESVFTKNIDKIKIEYFNNSQPSFSQSYLEKKELLKTYRFGKNLTALLDKFIYKNGLHSELPDAGLFYINVNSSIDGLSNINEVNKITEYIKTTKLSHDQTGIITPFRKQADLLKKSLPYLSENIMTIHKSQGREFETVILSPVMLHFHLTNSNNISAKYALNVALSRVKKNLIIVCDYNFWIAQKNQLLSEILLISKPI